MTDNPYVNVLLEVDDWRNEGGHLLASYGGTGKMDGSTLSMVETPLRATCDVHPSTT